MQVARYNRKFKIQKYLRELIDLVITFFKFRKSKF